MKNTKYLVLVEAWLPETERIVFIPEFFNTNKSADKFAEELWTWTKIFCNCIVDQYGKCTICTVDEVENIVNILKRKNYSSYSLKGSKHYIGNSVYFTTNEAIEISTLEIDMNKFCLKSFIHEHQNLTSIFD